MSTRAATFIQVLTFPTSLWRGFFRRGAVAVARGYLIEKTEPRLPVVPGILFRLRNHANYLSSRNPLDLITWMEIVFVRNDFGHGDLILRRNLHILTVARIRSLFTLLQGHDRVIMKT